MSMPPELVADFEAFIAPLQGSKPFTPQHKEIFLLLWLAGGLAFMKRVAHGTDALRTSATSPLDNIHNLASAYLSSGKELGDLFTEYMSALHVRDLITRAKAG